MKQTARILTASAALACMSFLCQGATLIPGYAPGSGALAPDGETLFIDRAALQGGDATYADGWVPFSVEIPDIWEPGMEVTLTGIAIPVHLESQPGTFTFTFYDLNGGGNSNAFDGTEAETVVGTATAVLGSSATSPHYVIFDTPVSFTSKSKGVAVHIRNSAKIRLKINTSTPAPRAIRKSNVDGSTYDTNPHLRMSLAGRVKPDRVWYGNKGNTWDTYLLNWDLGEVAYKDGSAVLFDDTLDTGTLHTNVVLSASVSPSRLKVNNSAYDYNFSGPGKITGSAVFTKQGSGALTLHAANDFDGGSLLEGGMVRLGNDTGLGTGLVTISGSGISSDSTTLRTVANNVDLKGQCTFGDAERSGLLTLSGTVTFGNSGRDIAVLSDVVLSGTSSNGGFATKSGGGNLILTGTGAQSTVWGIGEGSIVVDGGAITGSVVRVSAQLPQQTARLVVTNGGSLMLTGNMRIGSAPEFPGHSTSTNILDLDGFLSAGSIQVGDQSALAQVNLYPGSYLTFERLDYRANQAEVNVDGGTMIAKMDTASFIEEQIAVNIRAGGLTMDSAGFSITVPATFSGSGGLTKLGSGTIWLNGANQYFGTTLVNEGTLAGTGGVLGSIQTDEGATLAPGQNGIGTFMVGGSAVLNGTLAMEINKTDGSADKLTMGANLVLSGALTVTQADAAALAEGDRFTLFETTGTRSGWFNSVALPSLGADLFWNTNGLARTGVLEVYSFTTTPMAFEMVKNSSATVSAAKMSLHASSLAGAPVAVIAGEASNGIAAILNGALTYTPNYDFVGIDEFSVIYSDGNAAQTMSVSVTVKAENVGPAITSGKDNGAGYYTFSVSGLPGATYQVQAQTTDNNITGNWETIGTATAAGNGVVNWTDPEPITAHQQRLYRMAQ